MPPPFDTLEYLYVGSDQFEADVAYYRDVLKGELVFNLEGFGAHVAAFRLSAQGPMVLLADHRPPRTIIPIYTVPDLKAEQKKLEKRGWKAEGPSFEVPDGPVLLFKDPTGNEYALLEPRRPHVLEQDDEE